MKIDKALDSKRVFKKYLKKNKIVSGANLQSIYENICLLNRKKNISIIKVSAEKCLRV